MTDGTQSKTPLSTLIILIVSIWLYFLYLHNNDAIPFFIMQQWISTILSTKLDKEFSLSHFNQFVYKIWQTTFQWWASPYRISCNHKMYDTNFGWQRTKYHERRRRKRKRRKQHISLLMNSMRLFCCAPNANSLK